MCYRCTTVAPNQCVNASGSVSSSCTVVSTVLSFHEGLFFSRYLLKGSHRVTGGIQCQWQ